MKKIVFILALVLIANHNTFSKDIYGIKLLEQAENKFEQNEYDEALSIINSFISNNDKKGHFLGKANILKGKCLMQLDKIDESIYSFQQAFNLSEKFNLELKKESLDLLVKAYKLESKYKNGIPYLMEYHGLLKAKNRINTLEEIEILCEISLLYSITNDSNDTLRIYSMEGISKAKKIRNIGFESCFHSFLSQHFRSVNNFFESYFHQDEANNLYKKSGNKFALMFGLIEEGDIHTDENNYNPIYESAILSYKQAKKIAKELGEASTIYEVNKKIGFSYMKTNNFRKAVYYFKALKKDEENFNDDYNMNLIHLGLGTSLVNLGEKNSAKKELDKIYTSDLDSTQLIQYHKSFQKVYELMKDYKNAYLHVQQVDRYDGVLNSRIKALEEEVENHRDEELALRYENIRIKKEKELVDEKNQEQTNAARSVLLMGAAIIIYMLWKREKEIRKFQKKLSLKEEIINGFKKSETLLKEEIEKLERSLTQLKEKVPEEKVLRKTLLLKEDLEVDCDKILFLEKNGQYVNFHMEDRATPYLILGTIKKFLELLPSMNFSRCSQSYIVNLKKVLAYKKGEDDITIGGKLIPISRREKTKFYKNYIKLSK